MIEAAYVGLPPKAVSTCFWRSPKLAPPEPGGCSWQNSIMVATLALIPRRRRAQDATPGTVASIPEGTRAGAYTEGLPWPWRVRPF
jgi:hypothetical protein